LQKPEEFVESGNSGSYQTLILKLNGANAQMALAFRPCFCLLWKNRYAGLARRMLYRMINRARLVAGLATLLLERELSTFTSRHM